MAEYDVMGVTAVTVIARPPGEAPVNRVVREAVVRPVREATAILPIWSLTVQISAVTTTEPELIVSAMSSGCTSVRIPASLVLKKVW